MSRSLAALSALGLAACNSPSIRITFTIPPAYQPLVADVVTTAYQPNAISFSCDDVAFDVVPAPILFTTTIAQVRGSTPIDNLSRTAVKIFEVDGFTDAGTRIVSACGQVGTITSDTDLALTAEPVTSTTWGPPSLSGQIGANAPPLSQSGIVFDALGHPLGGIVARWATDPARGQGQSGGATSDGDGGLTLSVPLPSSAGPFALDAHVRWEAAANGLFTGVAMQQPSRATLPGAALDYRFGQIGPNRETGFATVMFSGTSGTGSPVFVALYASDGGSPINMPLSGVPQLGLVAVPPDAGPDRLLLVTANQWLVSSNAGASFTPSAAYVPTGANSPARVFGAGVCDGEDPAQPTLLVAFGDQSVIRYAADGTLIVPWSGVDAGTLNGVGCVSDQTGRRIRTSMIDVGSNVQSQEVIRIDEPTGPVAQVWLGVPIGLDFTTRPPPGPQPFVAAAYDVTAFAMTRVDLVETGGSHSVNVLSTEPVAGAPWSCSAGDIDGDGLLDVVCALVVPQPDAAQPPTLGLYLSLGRGHGSLLHLAGAYALDPANHRNPIVWVGDFNRDGLDDIVIAERPQAGVGNVSNVEIYPSGP